ncbi:hypothetical protein HanPSC8_Chr02g0083631 [Helianthus annuus]|nr:hypothetical protein HanPSC8_Chr02g0083631 [Helianthus annuus]
MLSSLAEISGSNPNSSRRIRSIILVDSSSLTLVDKYCLKSTFLPVKFTTLCSSFSISGFLVDKISFRFTCEILVEVTVSWSISVDLRGSVNEKVL